MRGEKPGMGYSDLLGVSGPGDLLNIAAINPATRSLGPGLRAVIWVQGCEFNCRGCIAPGWIPIRPARLARPEDIVAELLENPQVTGLTFSGGEPMLQAAALTRLAILARARRDLNIICFTGFNREYLERSALKEPALQLLGQIDVLIDGPYIESLNDNKGLRGSSNQRIHYVTDRLRQFDFATDYRKAEIIVTDGQAMMVGVPPRRAGDAFNQAVETAITRKWGLLQNERI
jgi:anaerobic ribonucleoside-triphosphate reductase activating protein